MQSFLISNLCKQSFLWNAIISHRWLSTVNLLIWNDVKLSQWTHRQCIFCWLDLWWRRTLWFLWFLWWQGKELTITNANESYIGFRSGMEMNNLLAALVPEIIDSSWNCMVWTLFVLISSSFTFLWSQQNISTNSVSFINPICGGGSKILYNGGDITLMNGLSGMTWN